MPYRSVLLALGLLLAAVHPPTAPAAELRVSDGEVVVEDGVAYVEVDVSWRLSWRNETNWDAAWLTVKAPVGREGVPLKLAPAGHRVVDTRTPDQPGPTFSVSDDSVGTFVYRDAQTDGRGPNDWTLRLRLVLSKCATPADVSWNGGYNAMFTGGDEGVGPLRVDIFETRAHRSDGPPGLRLATREWGDYGAHYRAPGMGVRAARTAP